MARAASFTLQTRAARRRRRGWVLYALPPVLMSVGVFCAYGCTECVAWIIAYAPNRDLTPDPKYDAAPETLRALGIDRQMRIEVKDPAASLSVWILEPRSWLDYPGGSARESTAAADGFPGPSAKRVAAQPAAPEPRGTILFLHGIRDRKDSLLSAARRHAARGYRCVLVDARGHGRSSGAWITYGAQESRDLVQVVDVLAARGLLAGELGVYGVSFGAAVGLQYAGRDPRVAAVVAISPFSSLRHVVPDYVQCYLPLSTLLDDQWVGRAIARAGELGQFDPDEADCSAALASAHAQVLLIHGAADRNIPPEHSQRLHDAAPQRTRLLTLAGDDHHTVTWDREGTIWRESTAWFDRWLGDK